MRTCILGIYQRSTTRYATTSRDRTQFCMLRTALHSAECELHMFMNLNCIKVEQDETDLDQCTFSMVEASRGFLLRMSLGSAVSTSSCGI